MAQLDLLSLDLHSAIAYAGMENPALEGAPLSGTALLPSEGGGFREVPLGLDMAEGEEEIFLFDAEELVAFDPDEGPSLRRPLPRPRYYGRRRARSGVADAGAAPRAPGDAAGRDGAAAGCEAALAAGSYAFVQWRPSDAEELASGIEWFARESWWERIEASGPYILRRVREDGRLATQVWRRTKG